MTTFAPAGGRRAQNLFLHLRGYGQSGRGLFFINRGETLGLVGESGCGKSVTALSIMRLIPRPRARIVGGPDHFSTAQTWLNLSAGEMREHPRQSHLHDLPGADDLPQPGLHHRRPDRRDVPAPQWPGQAGEPGTGPSKCSGRCRSRRPEKRVREYPHQLSGGMRQRAMIAMALCLQARPAHRRRADHRPGRDHPGPDPRSHAGSCKENSARPSC